MAARFIIFGLLTTAMSTQPYGYSLSTGKSALYSRGLTIGNEGAGAKFNNSDGRICQYVFSDDSWGYQCEGSMSSVAHIADSPDVNNGLTQVAIAVGQGLAGAIILDFLKACYNIMTQYESGGILRTDCVGMVRNHGTADGSEWNSCSKKVMVSAKCDYVFDAEAGIRCLEYAGNALASQGATVGCFKCSFHPGAAASAAVREEIYVKIVGGDGDPCDIVCGDYNVIYDH